MSRKGTSNLPVNMRNQLLDAEQIGAAFRVRRDLQKRNHNIRAGAELPQYVCRTTRSIPATTQQHIITLLEHLSYSRGDSNSQVTLVTSFLVVLQC